MRERTPTGADVDPDWDDDAAEGTVERLRAWFVPDLGEARGLVLVLCIALALTAVLLVGAMRRSIPDAAPDPALAAAMSGLPVLGEDGRLVGGGTEEADALAEGPSELVVQVSGAVARPGLVRLPPGARVGDAVEALGGLVPDADLARVNLARPLVDGEHVHVLAVGEEGPPGGGAPSGPGAGPAVSGAVAADGRLDVNRASVEELVTLPGIGPAKAAAIVDDRERNGPFRRTEDLQRVSGIGAATYARIADLITVG